MITLYERDGLPVFGWRSDGVDHHEFIERPLLFLSTGARIESATADLDRTSDIRDRTSEALFMQSTFRLNRALTQDELRSLLREMRPLESLTRLRIRYRGAPAADLFFAGRETPGAQVANFYRPDIFSRLKLREFGVAAQRPFSVGDRVDLSLSGAYRRVRRVGLIEFRTDVPELIDQAEAKGVFSRFVGPDKINGVFVFVRQDIHPELKNQRDRQRNIYAGTFTYQLFRPIPRLGRSLEQAYGRLFETRGIDFTSGMLHDEETYPGAVSDVLIVRRDYFMGVNVRGIGRFDVAVQPTWFSSKVSNDPSQYNSQYRTAGSVLFRIVDQERTPGMPAAGAAGMRLAFLHLVMPFRRDLSRKSLDAYENWRIGVRLHGKWFGAARGGTSFLAHGGYEYADFHRLRRHFHLFSAGLSMGF